MLVLPFFWGGGQCFRTLLGVKCFKLTHCELVHIQKYQAFSYTITFLFKEYIPITQCLDASAKHDPTMRQSRLMDMFVRLTPNQKKVFRLRMYYQSSSAPEPCPSSKQAQEPPGMNVIKSQLPNISPFPSYHEIHIASWYNMHPSTYNIDSITFCALGPWLGHLQFLSPAQSISTVSSCQPLNMYSLL